MGKILTGIRYQGHDSHWYQIPRTTLNGTTMPRFSRQQNPLVFLPQLKLAGNRQQQIFCPVSEHLNTM